MYEGTSTEQKAKNAKSRLNSMFNLLFIPSVSLRSTAPLTIRGAIYILFWRGSAHFIDNIKDLSDDRSFISGADYETRTRYLHLGKVTLYRMS